ncbi:MAG: iron-containing alcohol dehydrogenase family protein [Clostridiales bacterium]|nr:iron-containing alcohol dehydrogenase family protein [Clostridiales bacterium]
MKRKQVMDMADTDFVFPSYTMGESSYQHIAEICRPFGDKAVLIGGKTALAKAETKIRQSGMAITGVLHYGGEASYENVQMLMEQQAVTEAQMIFAVGGGKALDTAKCVASKTGKPVFTFPTIAGTCAASTSVSIMYHADGRFLAPYFFAPGPVHVFIDTTIVANAPAKYIRAGMGDSLAKYLESEMSGRNEAVPPYIAKGVKKAKEGYDVIMRYGREGYEAALQGRADEALAKTAEAVIMTIGFASVLLTHDHIIDYNTGLAHAVFYAMTAYEHIEKEFLHGEVVAFGCLILLLVDRADEFERFYGFNRWCRLPTQMQDLKFTDDMEAELLPKILAMPDIAHNAYPINQAMLQEAFNQMKSYHIYR